MHRRASARIASLLLAIAAASLCFGCSWVMADNPMSTVHPATPEGRLIQDIYAEITWTVLGIIIVVEGLLLNAILSFRQKPDDTGVPEQVHGNTVLEIGWTIVPVLIVMAIAVPTLRGTCALQQPPAANALTVHVNGKQWWWEFEYPEYGIVTANELHLPTGRMANLELRSDNVIHSFWVPRLMGKRDLVPSRGQRLFFTPEEPGWYFGQCAELCGASHAYMGFRVKVDTPQEFAAWVESQKAPAKTGMSDPGFLAFMQAGCIACHTINFEGSPARQRVGPNLTHVGSRTTIAAARFENTPENLARWLRNPPLEKPGSLMPALNLKDEQVAMLVSYLQNLK